MKPAKASDFNETIPLCLQKNFTGTLREFVFPMASSSYSSRSRSLFYSVLFVVILALFVIQAYIVAQKFINAPWEEVRAMQFQYNKHRTSS